MDPNDALLAALMRRKYGASSHRMAPLGVQAVGDTNEGRPAYLNADGSISTERSVTERHPLLNDGAWTNVPTIFNGREMPPSEAIDYVMSNQPEPTSLEDMRKVFDPVTGRELRGYGSIPEAIAAAQARSPSISVVPRPPWRSFWER